MNKHQLIYDIVTPNINALVKLLTTSKRKLMNHYWYLERCFFYPTYKFENTSSDFVARLSFYLGGVRDRLEESKTREETIVELKKVYQDVFLASHYNFGPKYDIFEICNNFHDQIEDFFDEDILGCVLGVSLQRWWLFTVKNKQYEIVKNNEIKFKGVTSQESTIALDRIPKGEYELKIYIGKKIKIKQFSVENFSSGVKINFF